MKPSTPDQQAAHLDRIRAWMEANGGEHVRACIFRHNGVTYDLSAANPDALPEIVRHRYFALDAEPQL